LQINRRLRQGDGLSCRLVFTVPGEVPECSVQSRVVSLNRDRIPMTGAMCCDLPGAAVGPCAAMAAGTSACISDPCRIMGSGADGAGSGPGVPGQLQQLVVLGGGQ
jgi:hypothetical protein